MNNTKRLYEYVPELSSAPGDTLKETLEALGMTERDLALRTGLSPKTISGIVNGKEPLSQDTALQLETVLGVPASLWNNLERQYQEYKARSNQLEKMRAQEQWLEKFPLQELVRRGWVERRDDPGEQVLALLEFFGCAEPRQCDTYLHGIVVQYRASQQFVPDDYALSAWLRQGERMAQQIDCVAYGAQTFKSTVQSLRGLTLGKLEESRATLQQQCAAAGVAVVFVQELKGIRASGAARWLTPEKAMIQLDFRYKSEDQVWFSFFHEAAHILLHGKRQIFVDGTDSTVDEREQQANDFAQNKLIPANTYADFLRRGDYSESAIKAFADCQGIAPGVVVGRLQHDGHVRFNVHNGLKQKLDWANANTFESMNARG